MLKSGWVCANSPIGWSIKTIWAAIFTAAVAGDLLTTAVMLKINPQWSEGNPLAQSGMHIFGVLGYATLGSAALLLVVFPWLVATAKGPRQRSIQFTAYALSTAKVLVVISNILLWVGIFHP